MDITEDLISLFAPAPDARKTGHDLVRKQGFFDLEESEDGSALWGKYRGSGSKPYICSVDFLDPEKPIDRCTCPSRRKPCKHTIGLLYAKLEKCSFTVTHLPDFLVEAREKDLAKAEKKTPAPLTPAKAASKAKTEAKKCAAQITGISLAEKLLNSLVRGGFAAATGAAQDAFTAQIQELGNYYIPGVQAAVTELFDEIPHDANLGGDELRAVAEQSAALRALLVKGKAYMERKKADFEAFPQTPDTSRDERLNSSIEEQLGTAWKLSELRDAGRAVSGAELLQVSFETVDDDVRNQWVDTGLWFSLGGAAGDGVKNAAIYETRDFRLYRRNDPPVDSFHQILTASELYVYPSADKNPRVRWEKAAFREITAADYQKALSLGETDFAAAIKEAKNQMKSPLSSKTPVYALRVSRMGLNSDGGLSIFDEKGTRIMLTLRDYGARLRRLSREQVEGKTLIAAFKRGVDDFLYAEPLSMITDNALIRFV